MFAMGSIEADRAVKCSGESIKPNRIAQDWSADRYAKHDFVPALGQDLLSLLKAKPEDRILDLGCGDGTLTEKLLPMCAEVSQW